jgi:phage-related baseplate assembly protein
MSNRLNLPDITFCEKSASEIEADFLANYESLTGISLTKTDPRRIFAQALITIVTQQRVLIDQSAKQNLLSYSMGDNLDNLGAFTETKRIEASYASATVRVTLSSSLTEDKVISADTQVTSGDGLYWKFKSALTIPAGSLTGDITVECTTLGTDGNGYAIGKINTFVTPITNVASVVNTTVSSGGADVESDDAYAERIRQAPESFSVAGPDGAYVYWAKTTSQLIIDVSVRSPSAGAVEIRPLLLGGALPDQALLDAVLAKCNAKNIRPLTDSVTVIAPAQISYNITATYYIRSSDATISTSIQSAVNQAIEDYKVWQKSKLGRAIDPSELIYKMKAAGAKRVVVTFPVYTAIAAYQVATEGTITVNYGGLEDE